MKKGSDDSDEEMLDEFQCLQADAKAKMVVAKENLVVAEQEHKKAQEELQGYGDDVDEKTYDNTPRDLHEKTSTTQSNNSGYTCNGNTSASTRTHKSLITQVQAKGKRINQGLYDDDGSKDDCIVDESDSDLDDMFDTPMQYGNSNSKMLGNAVTINCAENTVISSISDHGGPGGEEESPIHVDTDEGNDSLRSDNEE